MRALGRIPGPDGMASGEVRPADRAAARMALMEPFRWSVRASSRADRQVTLYVRRHQFTAGEALSFDEEYEQVTALEMVLGALAADLVTTFRRVARKRRVQIDALEALVRGELNNPLTFLDVVGETGHPGLERVNLRVYVSSWEETEELEALWQEALRRSPLVCTLRNALQLDLEWSLSR